MARSEEIKIARKLKRGELLGKMEIAYQNGEITREEWIAEIEHDYNSELSRLDLEKRRAKEEAVRDNDAIAFLKAEREYSRGENFAKEQRDLALAYIEDVFSAGITFLNVTIVQSEPKWLRNAKNESL